MYALPNNIRVSTIMANKLGRIVWAGHAARAKEMRGTFTHLKSVGMK